MGEELFNRAYRLQIHELEVTGLTVDFRIQKTIKPEPDTATLLIYNLNAEHRAQLQHQQKAEVRFEAGYLGLSPPVLSDAASSALSSIGVAGGGSNLPVLFAGEMRECWSQREGTDWITTLTTGDGDTAKKKTTRRSFAPGVALVYAVEQLSKDLGLQLGEVPPELATAQLFRRGRGFASGLVLTGNGFHELSRLLYSSGFEWTVTDGQIVIVKRGRARLAPAVVLSQETGLVGSPEPASDGRVQATALLQAELQPYRQVMFDSELVKGHHRIETTTFAGSSRGGPWYARIVAKEVGP